MARAEVAFGAPPARLSLKAGEYALTLSREGKVIYATSFSVTGGGEVKRVVTVAELFGSAGEGAGEASAAGRPLKASSKWGSYDLKRKRLTSQRKIAFSGDSANLTSASAAALKGLGELLSKEPRISAITIQVHTHSIGSAAQDKQLGERRGEAVRRALAEAGVPTARLKVVSFGSSKTLSSNLTRRGREQNQRVTFSISVRE